MAIIIDSEDCITTKGIITLEDVVEELIGVRIIHEQPPSHQKFFTNMLFLFANLKGRNIR